MTGPGYVWAPGPDGIVQPRCDRHEDIWLGPPTYKLEAASINVGVHNTDMHPPEASTAVELDLEPHSSTQETT